MPITATPAPSSGGHTAPLPATEIHRRPLPVSHATELIARSGQGSARRAVHTLGLGQVISWGTVYYVLGVLAEPIGAHRGWSNAMVLGGLTVGLLVAAATSHAVGARIDRNGAREPMAVGAILAAGGLAALAIVPVWGAYLAVWALLGLAMRLTLYDAAFAAVVQANPTEGKRAIAYVSLWGGFASSVFWPAGHFLSAQIGWQATLLVFAGLNAFVCAPLYWFGTPVSADPTGTKDGSGAKSNPAAPTQGLAGPLRHLALVVFGGAMGVYAFIMGAAAVQLIQIVTATGIALEAAVTATAFVGIAQVGARFLQTFLGQRLPMEWQARLPIWTLPLAFVVLMVAPSAFATAVVFAVLFGGAKGLFTILRGTLPLELFGSEGYARVLGGLAVPFLISAAIAPFAVGLLDDAAGSDAVLTAMTLAAFVTLGGIEALLRLVALRR